MRGKTYGLRLVQTGATVMQRTIKAMKLGDESKKSRVKVRKDKH